MASSRASLKYAQPSVVINQNFIALIPISEIHIAKAGPIRGEDHLLSIGCKGWMQMTALSIAESVGVVSTQNFKLLTSITQLYFGDAARSSFTICLHCLSIGMQVVVSIPTARGVV